MTIEPEVIPTNSNEGETAKVVYPNWLPIAILIIAFSFLVFFLKTIFTLVLMVVGLIFIWKQIEKLLSLE